ncbi:hypothetical protein Dimus_010194 [Dionaea muscipula]
MGCGESKHAVATTESVSIKKNENSTSSSSRRSQHGDGDDHQPTSKRTSRTSSRAPSRSASTKAKRQLEAAADVIEKVVDEKMVSNIIANVEEGKDNKLEAKEMMKVKVNVNDQGNHNMVGDQDQAKVALEKVKEVGHDRTASRESQTEYFSNQSEYETPLHEPGEEKDDLVLIIEKANVEEQGKGENEVKEMVAVVIQEKKEETDQGKAENASEVEGLKEAIPSESNAIGSTKEDVVSIEPSIEQKVTSAEAEAIATTSVITSHDDEIKTTGEEVTPNQATSIVEEEKDVDENNKDSTAAATATN